MNADFPVRISHNYLVIFILSLFFCKSSFIYSQSTIEGIVWNDINADGLNQNEQGISGIPVFLMTCAGQFIQSTLTSNSGTYSFLSVADNNYKIYINKSSLPQYVFTLTSATNHINSNGYSLCNVTSNNTYTINAGLTILPKIGDNVWEDLNGNGLQDTGEPGINGVIVSLYSSPSNQLIEQTTTDQNGQYHLSNIFPGAYFVKFVAGSSFFPTLNKLSNAILNLNSDITNANGTGTTDLINIQTGPDLVTIDAGFYRCIKVCGIIYSDADFSNTLDEYENGINGLKIKLWYINASKDTVLIDEKFTSSKPGSPSKDGYYEFCVFPGKYFIETEIPSISFLIPGLPKIGNNTATYNHITHENGINTTYTFDLKSGDSYCNINNGFYCYGSIHLKVWMDYNGNGMLDNGEVPLSEVPITLYNMQYQQIGIKYSDVNGDCFFYQLKNGNYFIYLNIDPSFSFTLAHAGDDNNDNDIDNSFGAGTSNVISVTECSRVDNLGAGLALQPLPVIWGNIIAINKKSYNIIEWAVNSQINTSHYIVLKNTWNSKIWHEIAIIDAKSNQDLYSIDDYDIRTIKAVNYKIISVDYDGKKNSSKIVSVNAPLNERNIRIQPVPADDFIDVFVSQDLAESEFEKMIHIYNATGNRVKSVGLSSESIIQIPTQDLPSGLYKLVILHADKVIESKSFSLVR